MRSGRFLQRQRKLRNPRARRKQLRTRAWHAARKAWARAHPECTLAVPACTGRPEVHDVHPWSTLNAAQQNSIEFLLGNFRTLCRHHHRQQHPHLS